MTYKMVKDLNERMATANHWLNSRDKQLIEYLDNNIDLYQIAELMECSRSSVKQAMVRIGRDTPRKTRRAIDASTRPKKSDKPKTPRDCMGAMCLDKENRVFMSYGPGNRMCFDCTVWAANNGSAMV